MNYFIYVGVVAFGAITLLIEARRNYAVSARKHPFAFYPILENTNAQQLCSRREWNYGFYIYSLLYLVSYAILLSFTELFELVRDAEFAKGLVGATGDAPDPLGLAETVYGKPIFVSAFIIAFYSLGATRNIEEHIRTLAHRLAGVPRGVLGIIGRLQNPNFLGTTAPPTGPLLEHLQERLLVIGGSSQEVDELNALLVLPAPPRIDSKEALDKSKKTGGQDQNLVAKPETLAKIRAEGRNQYIVDIGRALRSIDCLHPTISGGQRASHFPLLGLKELTDLSDKLDKEIDELREAISDLQELDANSLIALKQHTIAVANNAQAVFAVYYIGNSRTILNVEKNRALDRIKTFIDRGYRVELNAMAAGLLFSFVVTIITGYVIYEKYRDTFVQYHPVLMIEQVHPELLEIDAEAKHYFTNCKDRSDEKKIDLDRCDNFEKKYNDFGRENPQGSVSLYLICLAGKEELARNSAENGWSATKFDKKCGEPIKAAANVYAKKNQPNYISYSFWDALISLAAVFAVAQMTIFERDIRQEQNTWRRWTFFNLPYVRLVTASVLPALAGVIVLVAVYFLKLFWDMGFALTTARAEALVLDNWRFFIANLAPYFVLSATCFILMDKHDDWPMKATLLAAIAGGAAYACIIYSVILFTYSPYTSDVSFFLNFQYRDTIQLSLLPAVYLFVFGGVLEITEVHEHNKERKLKEMAKDRLSEQPERGVS